MDFIGWDNSEICHRQYNIFPQPFDPEKTLPITPLVDAIKSYFTIGIKKIKISSPPNEFGSWENFIWEKLGGNCAWEALKNCQDHSGFYNGNSVIFGLFLAPNGVSYGFHDGGDYFKRAKIKEQWENKHTIEEFNVEAHQRRCGGGTGVNNYIFPRTDLIEVDPEKGILYLANTLEGKL